MNLDLIFLPLVCDLSA